MSQEENKEGWGFPVNARKAHYFRGGISLCGRWMHFGRCDNQVMLDEPGFDDCRECHRRRLKEVKKVKAS